MTRRQILLSASAALAGPLRAQHILYRDYSRCLPDFLRGLAREAYERRNRAIAELTTPEAVRARQEWVRTTFWSLVGGRPEKTPLNSRNLGAFERPGYRVEKILYESQPNFHVPALLYIPGKGKPPFPGVLFQMGHTLNGKAGDAYQKCCQGLAQLGFLVLAFDPMGQGERTYYPRSGGTLTRLSSADEEHSLPGRQMLLTGDTATRMQVWDAVRSLDYLASHPLVDPARLATTGQSGGGTVSMLLAAVDERLAAAAIASGNTENLACADFNPPGSTDDAEQDLINSGPAGFDRWDLLYPIAPKPLLVLVSAKDSFGTYSPQYLTNGREEFEKLRAVYGVLDKKDHLAWGETPLPHNLSYELRMQIYSWFARWLQNSDRPIGEEPPVRVESDETLWVSPGGNVVRAFHGETPFTKVRAFRIPAPRPATELVEPLGIEKPRKGLKYAVVSQVPARRDVVVEAIEVPSAGSVWLPAWIFRAKEGGSGKTFLAVDPAGRNQRWHEGEIYPKLAAQGHRVCAADVRGVGDLTPEYGRGNPRYEGPHERESEYAWASLMLGKPLLGQRVTDILAVVESLGGPVTLLARRALTPPALISAALDSRIEKLYLEEPEPSYRSIIENEIYSASFANFAFGILKYTDLPEIEASLGSRVARASWTSQLAAIAAD